MTVQDERWKEIERVGLRAQPMGFVEMPFVQCAAVACAFEMTARRYADNTPELRNGAFAKLSGVVEAIMTHVISRTTADERALLDRCARVRNKLLHLELSRATGQLRAFGLELDEGHVTLVSLETGASTAIASTATATGRIQGWLLEGARSGAFVRAGELFTRGIALIGWLRAVDSGEA